MGFSSVGVSNSRDVARSRHQEHRGAKWPLGPTTRHCATPRIETPIGTSDPVRKRIADKGQSGSFLQAPSLLTDVRSNTSTGSYTAGPIGSVTDVVCVADSLGETVCAEVAVGVGVSINPASSRVQTGGTQVFEVSGGSGAGHVWSLATNAAGGSIRSDNGAYTAGSPGGAMDVAKVTDSLGNVATANVTVTTPPSGGGCNHGAVGGPGLIGLALAFLLRPRSRRSGDDGQAGTGVFESGEERRPEIAPSPGPRDRPGPCGRMRAPGACTRHRRHGNVGRNRGFD